MTAALLEQMDAVVERLLAGAVSKPERLARLRDALELSAAEIDRADTPEQMLSAFPRASRSLPCVQRRSQ